MQSAHSEVKFRTESLDLVTTNGAQQNGKNCFVHAHVHGACVCVCREPHRCLRAVCKEQDEMAGTAASAGACPGRQYDRRAIINCAGAELTRAQEDSRRQQGGHDGDGAVVTMCNWHQAWRSITRAGHNGIAFHLPDSPGGAPVACAFLPACVSTV